MSSRIELRLTPSAAAGALSVVPWLILAGFLLAASAGGKIWLLAGLPFATAGALFQYRSSGLLKGRSTVDSLLLEDDQLYARLSNERRVAVTVAAACRIGSRLTLLKLRPVGTRFLWYSVILLADTSGLPGNVPNDEFRRLRMWLRLGRSRPASR